MGFLFSACAFSWEENMRKVILIFELSVLVMVLMDKDSQ